MSSDAPQAVACQLCGDEIFAPLATHPQRGFRPFQSEQTVNLWRDIPAAILFGIGSCFHWCAIRIATRECNERFADAILGKV